MPRLLSRLIVCLRLQERGRKAKALVGVHHMLHKGTMFQVTGWGMQRQIIRKKASPPVPLPSRCRSDTPFVQADGRTMVDTGSFVRMNAGNEVAFGL